MEGPKAQFTAEECLQHMEELQEVEQAQVTIQVECLLMVVQILQLMQELDNLLLMAAWVVRWVHQILLTLLHRITMRLRMACTQEDLTKASSLQMRRNDLNYLYLLELEIKT